MKRVVTSKDSFKKSNLREGVLSFDNTRVIPDPYYSGETLYRRQFHYYYDSVVHLNFAQLQDAEDWEDAKELETRSIKNILVDVLDDLSRKSELRGLQDHIHCVDVTIDVYGPGTRSIPIKFTIDGVHRFDNPEFTYTFDPYRQFQESGNAVYIGAYTHSYSTDGLRCWMDMKRIQPDSSYMKRKVVPYIVNYLSEGYDDLI